MSETAIPAEEFGYGLDVAGLDMGALVESLQAVIAEAMSDPGRMLAWTSAIANSDAATGMRMLQRFADPAIFTSAATATDKRFADRAWRDNPFLASVYEAYIARASAALALVERSSLPAVTRRKARFAMQILTDALAPTNVPWLNPTVVKEAMDSGGASIMRGLQTYLDDVRSNDGKPRQNDPNAFVLGTTIAATPGRVVYRNELIELLAYEPQTADVYATPLLCSPPWINKYYIMDLAPGRSFIEFAVRQGHQTFAISYRNPDATLGAYGMDEYLRLGPLAALDAIERMTGTTQTNIAALCLGGTMTVVLLAYLAARGQAHRVGVAALTNTMVDFTEPGDLGVFTDEATIARLESQMNVRGYLDSKEMAGTFDWMRANDLIWGYVVNNWFLGRTPPAFDILHWNADSTRMPAKMHSQYLRSCYLENQIVQPGRFTIDGTPIDLTDIRTPLYVLGAEGDHIAPWRSSYRTTQHVRSDDVTYTLSNAGHVAGIVNPVNGAKAVHWTKGPTQHGEDADTWRASATKHAGSWWTDWAAWMATRSGLRRAPYDLPPGEPAPGRYVRNEVAEPYDPRASTSMPTKRKKAKRG